MCSEIWGAFSACFLKDSCDRTLCRQASLHSWHLLNKGSNDGGRRALLQPCRSAFRKIIIIFGFDAGPVSAHA